MGRKRWRERRRPRNPIAASFDIDPWRPHDPDPEPPEPEPSPRLVEHNTRALEAFKAVGIRGADVVTPRLLCGHDYGGGTICREPAFPEHEHCCPDDDEQERAETERSLNGGTSLIGSYDEAIEMAAREVLAGNSYVDAATGEHLDPFAVSVKRDPEHASYVVDPGSRGFGREGRRRALLEQIYDPETARKLDETATRLEALPAVSNPAPGLWEIVTGKPLPSYAELIERGRRAEHPTYDLLNVQSTRAPELSSAEACDRLAAALERPRLAARVTEVTPPALVSQLALAVEEAVRRGIAAHIAQEKATLDQMADAATQRLQQSIEDQKRGREANAERWTTPSRLS